MAGFEGVFNFSQENISKETIHSFTKNNYRKVLSHQDKGVDIYVYSDEENIIDWIKQENNDYLVIFSGNVSNTSDLKRNLLKEEDNSELSITNLIGLAYRKWGVDCVKEFKGNYAFIIWDPKDKKILLVSDAFASLPIFFSLRGELLFFSTNINSLLKIKEIKKTLDNQSLAAFIQMENISYEDTFYKEIKCLPSFSALEVSHKDKGIKLVKKKFFLEAKAEEIFEPSKLRKLLETSIKNKITRNEKIGLLLSGGLDSSSIAVITKRLLNTERINTISFVFPDLGKSLREKCDETNFQNSISKAINSIHSPINGSEIDILYYTKLLVDLHGQPAYFPNSYIFFLANQKAKNQEIKQILTGAGGDSIISWGYENLREQFIKLKLFKFLMGVKKLASIRRIGRKNILKTLVFNDIIKPMVLYILIKISGHLIFTSNKKTLKRKFVYKTRILNYIYKAPKVLSTSYHKMVVNAPDHQNIHSLLKNISDYGNIRLISPFYDEDLACYSLSLSGEVKLKDGYERYALRKSLKGLVPDLNLYRQDKANVGISFLVNFHKQIDEIILELKDPHPYFKKIINLSKLGDYLDFFKNLKEKELLKNQEIASEIYCLYIINYWLNKQQNLTY